MWKSQFVTRGEVIVFMDADLLDWDTHFVPGLLGPLLTRPEVQLVKGFYERPMVPGETVVPFEGGRVTELVARPLIRLLFPELGGLHQPLAGEWAIRRSLFETLSVPTGYAVELAALVDTVRAHGLDALAQVDLGTRAHRHQSLRDLSGMATQILAAALARAGVPTAGDAEPGAAAGGRAHDAAAGPRRVRRRRDADDGDRQPDTGLVLRQGRHLGRGQGLRAGRPGRPARAPRSSTSAASRPPPASRSARPRRRRGSSTSWPGCARRSRPS